MTSLAVCRQHAKTSAAHVVVRAVLKGDCWVKKCEYESPKHSSTKLCKRFIPSILQCALIGQTFEPLPSRLRGGNSSPSEISLGVLLEEKAGTR